MAFAACGDAPAPEADAAPTPEASAPALPSVTILEPADGAMLDGGTVVVRLSVDHLTIVPAGDMTEHTGHHHLYLDAELTEAGAPVPTIPGSVVHMGDGSAEYTFEGVEPGNHRLIAVVADGIHIPLQPWVVDTVTFMVH